MCDMRLAGADPGAFFVLSPKTAKELSDMGMTKQDIMDYIMEYARRPAEQIPRMIIGNNHEPKGFILPKPGKYIAKKYFSQDHMAVLVGGQWSNPVFLGDGGHGTPAGAKIDLPQCWPELMEDYSKINQAPVRYY